MMSYGQENGEYCLIGELYGGAGVACLLPPLYEAVHKVQQEQRATRK